MRTKKIPISRALASMLIFLFVGYQCLGQEKWEAPTSSDKLVNPLKGDVNANASGKKLYKALCLICHGAKGKGDGMGGTGLTPKPANLISSEFQSQTDGAIFWKIAEGRAPMASYKTLIPEKNRWEIINYIRTLN